MDSNNRPKPHPPIKKVETPAPDIQVPETKIDEPKTAPTTKTADKKPFKLSEHLTERPFKHHEGLQQLKESIGVKRSK